ncbi:MAG: hypothetical protein IT348_10370 [Candidatus Eisenbacteria bacterium]|nr:hypothetical protein [Candidatus Eisenbacteria bacterium]
MDAVIVLRHGATLAPDDFSKESLDELLRAALALAVGALDRYVHERVTKGIVRALRSGQLSREQRDFPLPATVALRIADRVRDARNAAAPIRPANEFRKAVQEEIHKRPFQGWRDIEKAFKLIGVARLAGSLQAAYGVADFTPIRDELNGITSRRNRIVHEGDLQVHQRAGGVRRNRIEHGEVARSLDFIEDFVNKLEQV